MPVPGQPPFPCYTICHIPGRTPYTPSLRDLLPKRTEYLASAPRPYICIQLYKASPHCHACGAESSSNTNKCVSDSLNNEKRRVVHGASAKENPGSYARKIEVLISIRTVERSSPWLSTKTEVEPPSSQLGNDHRDVVAAPRLLGSLHQPFRYLAWVLFLPEGLDHLPSTRCGMQSLVNPQNGRARPPSFALRPLFGDKKTRASQFSVFWHLKT